MFGPGSNLNLALANIIRKTALTYSGPILNIHKTAMKIMKEYFFCLNQFWAVLIVWAMMRKEKSPSLFSTRRTELVLFRNNR